MERAPCVNALLCSRPCQEWEALQQSIQRRERALLETKSKVTHPAYSLYFPEEKQEWWWLYIADRRDQTLVSMPYHVCTLKDTEEVSAFYISNAPSQHFSCEPSLKWSSHCKDANFLESGKRTSVDAIFLVFLYRVAIYTPCC